MTQMSKFRFARCLLFMVLISIAMLFLTGCRNATDSSQSSQIQQSDTLIEPHPRLKLMETEIDMGHESAGKILERKVSFKNTGSADLVIKRAMGVGSKITVRHPETPIKSGESGELHILYDTQGQSGAQNRRIVIISNDPIEPRAYIALKADLDLHQGVSPRRVWFGSVSGNQVETRDFSIVGSRIQTIDLASVSCKATQMSDYISFNLTDRRDLQETDRITVSATLDPSQMDPGQFNIPVEITTSIDSPKPMRVMLTGSILGPLNVQPSRLYFGRYEFGVPIQQELSVFHDDGIAFTIQSATTNSQFFTVSNIPSGAVTKADLSITFVADDTAEQRNRSVLTIETDLEKHGKIEVPLYAFRKVERNSR